jgi:hypothetical protein
MSDFHRWLQVYNPHTHLAHLTPNQHTPTCRSINDLVLKWPAYPQIGDILRGCPFLPPIEQVYLELHYTAGCEAEPLFHNSFTTKVHLLGPQHTRTTESHTRVQYPFRHLKQMHTQSLSPCSPPHCPSAEPFQLPFM